MVEMCFEPLNYLLLNGLSDLSYQAWNELEGTHREASYNVDWEAYERMEQNGQLRFISLRQDSKLIGYAAIVVQNDVNQLGVVMAILKAIYITPPKRGYAVRFVSYIEQQLSAVGVKRLIAAEKLDASTPNVSGEFYRLMGFSPLETWHVKTLH
jgi:hypothetical protein